MIRVNVRKSEILSDKLCDKLPITGMWMNACPSELRKAAQEFFVVMGGAFWLNKPMCDIFIISVFKEQNGVILHQISE